MENKSSWRSESGIIIYERDGGDIYETDESGSFHTQIIVAAFVIEGDPCLSHNGTMIVLPGIPAVILLFIRLKLIIQI